MKLGKKLGRIGLVIGFPGPVLFYASPPSFFTYESRFLCPWCPYIDSPFMNGLAWLGFGLQIGLICSLALALSGFVLVTPFQG